ncbi:hypothetical protein [Mesorhizobium sp. 131-2-1]|uniref:hypothetical protein n=1 Tax=Mesorhizobium sp. 131-2-1 TaxID=2744518 RepID=UPI001927E355|nr:hypothetical protein [Mesorhizobium sp. 131-2-1]
MLRLVATCLFLFTTTLTYAAPAIDWWVKHPFRYFTETTDFDMQREAMAEVMATHGGAFTATAVSDLERLLNDPRWLREWYKQDTTLYPNPKGAGRPERGWANPINLRRSTCWDSREQWHSSCKSDGFGTALRADYVRPQGHTVIFSVKDAPTGVCRWQAARPIFIAGRGRLSATAEQPCAAQFEARIPFEPDIPEAQRGVDVSVTLPDGTVLSQAAIWVRDRLIAGIGDSFSSGEGNPDTPVEIDPLSRRRHLNISFVYDPDTQAIKSVPAYSLPVRYQNAPAGWLDRKCHRSAYSYHLRTALQVALADPKHSAVTFLGFACSGAEVTEGLLFPYAGVETVNSSYFSAVGRQRRDLPQIDRLMIELCRDDLLRTHATRTVTFDTPLTDGRGHTLRSARLLDCKPGRFLRPIDMLIVSIGGNDVGFTPLIVETLTKTRPPYANVASKVRADLLGASVIRTVARIAKAHDVATARIRARELPSRFAALRKALAPLPIATNGGMPNIVLTAFPKIEFDQDGRLCGEATPRERLEGFNVGGVLSIDVPTLRPVSAFANDVLYPATRDAARAGNWHFVDAQRATFAKHGICAQKRLSSGVTAAESLMLPYYHADAPRRDKWSEFEPFSAYRDADFKATRDTRAYAPRERWFRTINDICLFVQSKASGTPPPPSQWALLDLVEVCLGGPFHPTAEGHSHIADAVFAAATTMLNLPQPTVADVRPH